MTLPDAVRMSQKQSKYPFWGRFLVLMMGGLLVFAVGLAAGHYGDLFEDLFLVKEPLPPASAPSVNFASVQMQLDRIEGLLTELSHRVPQGLEPASPVPLSLLGSLGFSQKTPSLQDQSFPKSSSGADLMLAKDLVDDLLLFFASQPLTSRDVDALLVLMHNLFPEKKTDDLLILRSSFAHFVQQAEALVVLPEPIVGAAESPAPAPSSFWPSLLGHFVTVRAPGSLSPEDAGGGPEVVGLYNDAYDTWQNAILPAVRKGRLDEAAGFVATLDARLLFAEEARWKTWKQDFETWLRCYVWLRSARMDMTRQMIQDMTQVGASPMAPLSPENPVKHSDGIAP